MAASITAKTVTATGTLLGGRTRIKSFLCKDIWKRFSCCCV